MKSKSRYLSALLMNCVLPWLAYWLTLPRFGLAWALVASAIPLAAWMTLSLMKLGHLDALTTQTLIGITTSLVTIALTGESRKRMLEEPILSGLIGCCFLLSLARARPISFYRARSSMARRSRDSATRFETLWDTMPELQGHIRILTTVWGVGLICENMVRIALVWRWPDKHWAPLASQLIQYASYFFLTVIGFWYRKTKLAKYAAK
ncbi:VC0807 family protein [Paraburkholderia pallida]|uniref:Intracellular septation protein A n=1 Tax=Paraburkholderia pallida TaxID=2547399 RepID=A0A4P7D5P4_9BURK|nr:VC0807 family protein [Paraburkholderia pallida]QBR03408.1 hypothetical protein E1956_40480 [Paraburkholderia pallida]